MFIHPQIVHFIGHECHVLIDEAKGHSPRLQLVDREDGFPVATATKILPGIYAGPDEVIIKDYSENAGILQALQEAGVIGAIKRSVNSAYVTLQICEWKRPCFEHLFQFNFQFKNSPHFNVKECLENERREIILCAMQKLQDLLEKPGCVDGLEALASHDGDSA